MIILFLSLNGRVDVCTSKATFHSFIRWTFTECPLCPRSSVRCKGKNINIIQPLPSRDHSSVFISGAINVVTVREVSSWHLLSSTKAVREAFIGSSRNIDWMAPRGPKDKYDIMAALKEFSEKDWQMRGLQYP